jgi:hypothetical protein
MKTKKLIYVLFLIATIICATSCDNKKYNNNFKYKQGEKVYTKLDNEPCIIQAQLNIDSLPSYRILYLTDLKEFETANIYEYNLTKDTLNYDK